MSPALAQSALNQLDSIVFNLHGTSESRFCILGKPALLSKKTASIGQPVWGVHARVIDDSEQEVSSGEIGRFCIRSAWSTRKGGWIETGDRAYQDAEGDFFLCGRVDDVVISGGENVYPIELENILIQHPDVDSVAVFGIPDEEFG